MALNVTLGYFKETEAIKRSVSRVLNSGRLSYGPQSRMFEAALAKSTHTENVILCNSGTSALVVAFQALKEIYDWPDGAEVICPALTFVASVNALMHCRLTPVLADVDERTYCLSPREAERMITERTVALLPVHLFGHPVDMRAIMDLAAKYDLKVVEDCCEAFGAQFDGKQVGSMGHVGCFSTYVGHHIVTGVGGFCATTDRDLGTHIRSLVNHGIDISELPSGEPYETTHLGRVFRFTSIGHSFRITELEAAIGIEQLREWDDKLTARRRNAEILTEGLKNTPGIRVPQEPWVDNRTIHSYMVYPIVTTNVPSVDVIAALKSARIESRFMMPLTNQPCYAPYFYEDRFPKAKHINYHGFYVGCHEGLARSELQHVINTLKEFFDERQAPTD
jgi:perosamine synthetase